MLNISECDKEPIHTPGAIQQFGFLFVLNKENLQIEQVSENISSFVDFNPLDVLGKTLPELFESKYHVYGEFEHSVQAEKVFVLEFEHKENRDHLFMELSTCIQPDYLIVEAIHVQEEIRSHVLTGKLGTTIERIEKTSNFEELCQSVVEEIQLITSFDRVMMYRFDEEWFGTVIAEKLSRPNVDSYLHHRFPASDIPAQARKMLGENLLRIIPNVNYRPSPLVPLNNPRTKGPTDIGRSLLRSPSPIHIEYLKNMKVGASLTVRILKEGNLWGLIACQHETPKEISQFERFCSQIIGRLVSSLITSKENYENYLFTTSLNSTLESIRQNLKGATNIIDVLLNQNPSIRNLNHVEGASLVIHHNNQWAILGNTPSKDEILTLSHWVKDNHGQEEIFATDSLAKLYPAALEFKNIAGVMVLNLPYDEDNFIMLFRPELESTVTWAGDPKKSEELKEGKLILHPRKSFEGWKEKVKYRSEPWKNSEIEVFQKLKRFIIEYELLRQYKQFQVLADSLDQFIWVSTADGTPMYFNKRWQEVTGLNRLEDYETQGKLLIHPEDIDKARELWKESIKEGTPFTCEIRFLTKEGRYIWTLCHSIPVKDDQGRVIKWYGSGVNIQEIKKIQSDLRKALRTRDEFISLASHELKTPITSLGLLLELSERSLKKSKDITPYVQKSIMELKRLRHLVDDLLDVTKINSGKVDFNFKQNNITEIIFHVLERFQNEERVKEQIKKFKDAPPMMVECDAFRIEQVVTNLVSNALKYGEDKPITVEVERNLLHVVVKVIDQGMGISKEDQKKLFNRFQRVGKIKGINGLGLGLYICKSIIDAHQGKIALESELGVGTTFYFELPERR